MQEYTRHQITSQHLLLFQAWLHHAVDLPCWKYSGPTNHLHGMDYCWTCMTRSFGVICGVFSRFLWCILELCSSCLVSNGTAKDCILQSCICHKARTHTSCNFKLSTTTNYTSSVDIRRAHFHICAWDQTQKYSLLLYIQLTRIGGHSLIEDGKSMSYGQTEFHC